MARIRTIKPEFWTDSKVVGLTPLARLLFIGAWNFADDYGTLAADPLQLKLRVLPAEQCDPDELVAELLDSGLLVSLTNGDETFWRVAGWDKHQKVDKRSRSVYGDPDGWNQTDAPPNPAESRRIPPSPRPGREGKGKDQGRDTTVAPDGDDLPSTNGKKSGDGLADDGRLDEFRDVYPRHRDNGLPWGGGSRQPALARWRKLTAVEREAAIVGAKHYAADVVARDAPVKHADGWLHERRWESYQAPVRVAARDGPDRLMGQFTETKAF